MSQREDREKWSKSGKVDTVDIKEKNGVEPYMPRQRKVTNNEH